VTTSALFVVGLKYEQFVSQRGGFHSKSAQKKITPTEVSRTVAAFAMPIGAMARINA